MGLRERAYHRILKLSRTIADLAGGEQESQVLMRDGSVRYRVDDYQSDYQLESSCASEV